MSAALPTVLVVDDRPNMLRLLQKVLRQDARVVTAGSGAEAIEALRSASVAVVVCDLKMPISMGSRCCDRANSCAPMPSSSS